MNDRAVAALLIAAAAAGAALAAPAGKEPRAPAMKLTSSAFKPRAMIPEKYTCDGPDVSPPLAWAGAPKDAKSFALIVDDPDAPAGTWVHWVIYDIPGATAALPEGLEKSATLASGAKQGAAWGVDKFDRVGYSGPCPPPGKPHRYFFKLYALSAALGLPPKATKDQVLAAMDAKILAQAELVGMYGRP